MGTRGAVGFYVGGKTKVGYNHWDSYPGGLGAEVVKWLQGKADPISMYEKARMLAPVPDREPTAEEIERLKPWTNLSVSNQSTSDWYCLLRETQGSLEATLESGFYSDAESFLADSLFCEWAFIINLDDEVFEVYKGFQKALHTAGRYSSIPVQEKGSGNTYYPVALVASFPLTAIPEDWTSQVDPPEEDE